MSDHEEPADPRSKAPLEGTSEDAVREEPASPLPIYSIIRADACQLFP